MPSPQDPSPPNGRLRWLRDHARGLVATGLSIYAFGFFLWWIFGVGGTWIFTFVGAAVGFTGVVSGFLWLVDASGGRDDGP